MRLKELLDLANQGYPDGGLADYYDDQGQLVENTGDSLARFVVIELAETYEDVADETRELQLIRARDVIRRAAADLEGVLDGLYVGLHFK